MSGKYRCCFLHNITHHETFKEVFNENCATQLAFTCSKLTIETLEQSVKYVQS